MALWLALVLTFYYLRELETIKLKVFSSLSLNHLLLTWTSRGRNASNQTSGDPLLPLLGQLCLWLPSQKSAAMWFLICWDFSVICQQKEKNRLSVGELKRPSFICKPPIYNFFLFGISLSTFCPHGSSFRAAAPPDVISASTHFWLCHPSHSRTSSCDRYFYDWSGICYCSQW